MTQEQNMNHLMQSHISLKPPHQPRKNQTDISKHLHS